jgi:N-acetylneuraminic acid mutarotase
MGRCNNCGTAEQITSRLYRYDPLTNTWEFRSRGPRAHAGGAEAVINGKFYVAGGTGANGRASNQLEVYNPVTNHWTHLAPMQCAHRHRRDVDPEQAGHLRQVKCEPG